MMSIQIINLIKRILIFSVFLIIGYTLLLFLFGSVLKPKHLPNLVSKVDHNYLRLQEVRQTSNVDLLFLGSSHAYRGFDTRIFSASNYKAFNLGSSSQTPVQTRVLLERYLENLNPKLVVYEVNPIMFYSDGVESTINLVVTDKNDFSSFKMVLGHSNIKVYNAYLYALAKNVYGDSILIEDKAYQEGGYVAKLNPKYFNGEQQAEKIITYKDNQIKNFEAILDILNERSINYVLVQAPVTSLKYNSYSNIKAFNSLMASYGDYYNYNEVLNLNDTIDFYDSHHLNQTGVNIFNKAFINFLDNNFQDLKE